MKQRKPKKEPASRVKFPKSLLVRMTTVEKKKLERAEKSGDKKQAEIVRGLINTHLP